MLLGWSLLYQYAKKTSNIKIGEILVCCLCVLLAATNFIEGCNSVYIGQFYKNVETQLENIEECSDEFYNLYLQQMLRQQEKVYIL